MSRRSHKSLSVLGVFFFCMSLIHSEGGAQGLPQISLIREVRGLSQPVHVTHANDGSGRLFIVEQAGRIRIVKGGVLLGAPLLDITGRVLSGGEQGLLSVAFPPLFRTKGYFYVYFTDLNGNIQVSRFFLTSDPDLADPDSEGKVLTVGHPTYGNHNGGQLAFGPDGFLYIGTGDGGGGGDPGNNAQNHGSLLGKVLRIDVESGVVPYAVPSTNPYLQTGGYRTEIWALGLRNPWRFSFDRLTGELYIGDVGQNSFEEIDVQPASSAGGENYGWNVMEGFHCYSSALCNQTGLTLPAFEYNHLQGDCSITGGMVYRGQNFPHMQGMYFYSDYCSGRIWGLKREGTLWQNTLLLRTPYFVSSFGDDEAGNLYLCDHGGGDVYRIVDSFSVMPVPSDQQIFSFPPVTFPVTDIDPAEAKPIGLGFFAGGGDTVSIEVDLVQFGGPVDIYFGVNVASSDPSQIYILRPDSTFQPVSEGLVPWKTGVTVPVHEPLFGDIRTSSLPPGPYTLYLAVMPAGNVGAYYLWTTSFVI